MNLPKSLSTKYTKYTEYIAFFRAFRAFSGQPRFHWGIFFRGNRLNSSIEFLNQIKRKDIAQIIV
jgi:hypothetical protein